MAPLTALALVALAVIVTIWITNRREANREREFYLISAFAATDGDPKERLNWLANEPLAMVRRLNKLYIIAGQLACRLDSLESVKMNYVTDRTMVQLEATLEEIDAESYEPDSHIIAARNNLEDAIFDVRTLAQLLLKQLAIETTRKTVSLASGKEARHFYRLEMQRLGAVMHRASVKAEEAESTLNEPLVEEAKSTIPIERKP